MSKLESFRKQAKQLVRWHRDGNYSVAGRIRGLSRYRELTDAAALALPFPLAVAQEVIAAENGHESWAALKAASETAKGIEKPALQKGTPLLRTAIPILFVSSVQASAIFFRDKLGFTIDFLHGNPPFYGSVSRGGARIHLRFVHEPAFVAGIVEKEQLICAYVEVDEIKSLYAEYLAKKVEIHGRLKKEAWGGSGFAVVDPDGNRIYFVRPPPAG
jgi:catechol 2,3-dioxygenase-like lactoylglutathione lyase family enzyme